MINKDDKTEKITYTELSKRVGDMVLMNTISSADNTLYDNVENGFYYDCVCGEEDCNIWGELEHEKTDTEVYQYYAISKNSAEYLKRNTDEIVFYSELLDIYFWGITHLGTSWDDVKTEIKAL